MQSTAPQKTKVYLGERTGCTRSSTGFKAEGCLAQSYQMQVELANSPSGCNQFTCYRAGKVVSRKLNSKNECWISKCDRAGGQGEKARHNHHLRYTGQTFCNQLLLPVRRCLSNTPTLLYTSYFLVYWILFHTGIVSPTSQYLRVTSTAAQEQS